MTERARKEYMDYCMIVNSTKEEGRTEAKIEVARNMIIEGDSIEKVMRCLGLSLDTVLHLAEEIKTETAVN